MFWPLFLAHVIADYPLQTDAMVRAKRKLLGLIVHVFVHLATMLVILRGMIGADWWYTIPAIISIATFHFAIDKAKNWQSQKWPQWVISTYVLDQIVHVASIILVVQCLADTYDSSIFAFKPPWLIYSIGYLFVTYVWFVTERLLSYKSTNRREAVKAGQWVRMGRRTIMFTLLVSIGLLWDNKAITLILISPVPYPANEFRSQFMLTDIIVSIGTTLWIQWVL